MGKHLDVKKGSLPLLFLLFLFILLSFDSFQHC